MNRDERNVLVATVGLAIVALGTFLPWARIGGRRRSGFNTADTFIGLADGALPNQIAWIGRWWYLPAALVIVAWGSTFFSGRTFTRVVGLLALVISLAMWWLFVWAGRHYGVLDTQLLGPIVSTFGMATVGFICLQQRGSIVRPESSAGGPSGPS